MEPTYNVGTNGSTVPLERYPYNALTDYRRPGFECDLPLYPKFDGTGYVSAIQEALGIPKIEAGLVLTIALAPPET